MKKAISATFLLFYATFTVVVVSEHTASFASAITRHSPSPTKTIRAASPHTYQVRILEDPYVGFQVKTTFALGVTGAVPFHSSSIEFEGDSSRFTPSRAPPALL